MEGMSAIWARTGETEDQEANRRNDRKDEEGQCQSLVCIFTIILFLWLRHQNAYSNVDIFLLNTKNGFFVCQN